MFCWKCRSLLLSHPLCDASAGPKQPIPFCARISIRDRSPGDTCGLLSQTSIAIPSPTATISRFTLLSRRKGVLDVIDAVITAQGANMTSQVTETATAQGSTTGEHPKAN
jgi:hypothetical protein